MRHDFTFGPWASAVELQESLPDIATLNPQGRAALVVCDTNTASIAHEIVGTHGVPLEVLSAGEDSKGWAAVERILKAAHGAGLARDGLFIGVGGGVIGDLVAFASSTYMRGASLVLVPTTLLSMVDASVGGKTGFDLFGIKNLVGTFRPADLVFMATDTLSTLPEREWKAGLAEVIKTAIIGDEVLFSRLEQGLDSRTAESRLFLIERSIAVKGRIVQNDPHETGSERALLNLGHTFAHALEAVAGLGTLSHGEAVAWGIANATRLSLSMNRISMEKARRIFSVLTAHGYETSPLHPATPTGSDALIEAMSSDKKKKAGTLRFVIPTDSGAEMVSCLQLENIKTILLGGIFAHI